ncbi:hypothetical protein [Nocardioides jejuensis]|uniref:Uncharacterized protein n=1 Tax=Nocardioides jejuensis TaxID=2502782 RepID=A0A4R1BVB0_9ACTN|nr:hypothetical protein [Nocardioides jejuensis]TCJ21648.1 hypothetical protein EPD65_14570 [Nocardioides jejuensis]
MFAVSGNSKAPDRCYVEGCGRENAIVLHLSATPAAFGDYCAEHARALAEATPLVWTCECLVCEAARRELASHEHDDRIVLCTNCVGRWLVTTASGSTHLFDLDAKTIQRVQAAANERPSRERAGSVPLRRDGDVLPLLHLDPIRLNEPACLLIGEVDDYLGYVNTTRVTTPVRLVEPAR